MVRPSFAQKALTKTNRQTVTNKQNSINEAESSLLSQVTLKGKSNGSFLALDFGESKL